MVKAIIPFTTQKWDLSGKEDSKIKRKLTFQSKLALALTAFVVIVIITLIVVFLLSPWSKKKNLISEEIYWMPDYFSNSPLGKYKLSALSTDAEPCAVIGKDILLKNGSAMDAAIAVLLCMGAVNPQSMGLGGGFLMTIYERKSNKAYFLNSREVAPMNATEDMYSGNETLSQKGGLSIAVPSELRGYYFAYERFGGNISWKELFLPTIKMCREGIAVNDHLAKALKSQEKLIMSNSFPSIRNIFVNNATGKIYEKGDIIKRPDLANTLETISDGDWRTLMDSKNGTSDLAQSFFEDLQNAGSIITKDDLVNYHPKLVDPVSLKLSDNMTLYSAALPGSGTLLAFMLNLLQGYPDMNSNVTKSKSTTVLALHRIVETFKFAYSHRMEMEDSDDLQQLITNLTSPEYANYIRKRISDRQTFEPDYYNQDVVIKEDHGTAHLSIVAPNGDAVSVTSTINGYFGSLVLSPSTGIILNNEMDDFSSPNITNMFGVPPSNRNRIHPGKSPLSSMTPTIIVDAQGNVRLVVGGNGGTQITTSVAQVIVRNILLGDNIKRSIDGPRLHHQLWPNFIMHKPLYPKIILEELKKFGHQIQLAKVGMTSIVMGVAREKDGFLYANSDYRKQGGVAGF